MITAVYLRQVYRRNNDTVVPTHVWSKRSDKGVGLYCRRIVQVCIEMAFNSAAVKQLCVYRVKVCELVQGALEEGSTPSDFLFFSKPYNILIRLAFWLEFLQKIISSYNNIRPHQNAIQYYYCSMYCVTHYLKLKCVGTFTLNVIVNILTKFELPILYSLYNL